MNNGNESEDLHCFKYIDGNPPGPDAALTFISSIACIISFSENLMSSSLAVVHSLNISLEVLGTENILLYCSASIFAILTLSPIS